MINKSLAGSFFMAILLSFYTSLVLAESLPIFAMTPLTATTGQLPSNGTMTVSYRVTNQTFIQRTLTIKPIAGVTQITAGVGTCSSPFILGHNQSCTLTLLISGGANYPHINGGPVVCKTKSATDNNPDPFLCAQPAINNRLSITRVGAESPAISVSPGTLSLVPDEPPVYITVFNPSQTVIATNIIAHNIPVAYGVTQNNSECVALAPRSTCNIYLSTTSSGQQPPIQILVYGDNTTTATFDLIIGLVRIRAPQSLSFLKNGSGTIKIDNLSPTLAAVNLHATIPAGSPIQVQSTTCPTDLPAEQSCTITFTSASTTEANVTISGDNTTSALVDINVGEIIITASPNPLAFTVGGSGTVTVTNTSSTISALNIRAIIPNGSPIYQISTTCPATLLPTLSCTFTFGATSETATATVGFEGDNTILAQVTMTTDDIVITSTPSSLSFLSQRTGSITITNTSATTNAQNITIINKDPSTSPVFIQSNGCASVAPGGSCVIVFSSSGSLAAGTTVTLKGPNTTSVTVNITVPQMLYYADSGNQAIYYSYILDSGAIGPWSPGVSLASPSSVTVNPNNTWLYVGSGGPSSVLKCSLADNGTFVNSDCSDAGAPSGITYFNIGIIGAGTGSYAYLVNHSGTPVYVCNIDANGSFTACSGTGSGFNDPVTISFNTPASFTYIANQGTGSISTCSINLMTGVLGGCNTFPTVLTANQLQGATLSKDNSLAYVLAQIPNEGYIIPCSLSGGAFTSCGPQQLMLTQVGGCPNPLSFSLNQAGNIAYTTCATTSSGFVFLAGCPVNNTGLAGDCIADTASFNFAVGATLSN